MPNICGWNRPMVALREPLIPFLTVAGWRMPTFASGLNTHSYYLSPTTSQPALSGWAWLPHRLRACAYCSNTLRSPHCCKHCRISRSRVESYMSPKSNSQHWWKKCGRIAFLRVTSKMASNAVWSSPPFQMGCQTASWPQLTAARQTFSHLLLVLAHDSDPN